MVWNIPADTPVPQEEGGNFFSSNGRNSTRENFSLDNSEGSDAKEEKLLHVVGFFSPHLSFVGNIRQHTTTHRHGD